MLVLVDDARGPGRRLNRQRRIRARAAGDRLEGLERRSLVDSDSQLVAGRPIEFRDWQPVQPRQGQLSADNLGVEGQRERRAVIG
jgi:hypothetical protein